MMSKQHESGAGLAGFGRRRPAGGASNIIIINTNIVIIFICYITL